MSDPGISYRTKEEVQDVERKDDPIKFVASLLVGNNLADEAELKAIEKEINAEVKEALEFSTSTPVPPSKELFTGIYINDCWTRGRELQEGVNPSLNN